jgi:hypothetical protein
MTHDLKLDLIPSSLVHLVPIVSQWGPLGQDQQDKKLAALLKTDPSEAAKLRAKLEEHRGTIRDWHTRTFGGKDHISQYSEADEEHPYWLYLSTLKLVESIPWEVTKTSRKSLLRKNVKAHTWKPTASSGTD